MPVFFPTVSEMCFAGGPCALAQDDEEVSMPVLELDPERAKGWDGRLQEGGEI
jgi:hypothetical protein